MTVKSTIQSRYRLCAGAIIGSFAIVFLVSIFAPVIQDQVSKSTRTTTSHNVSATSYFDFSSLFGLFMSWYSDLNAFQDSVVAAEEKRSGAAKELNQAKLLYEYVIYDKRALEQSQDIFHPYFPDSCQTMEEARQTDLAKDTEVMTTKALALESVNRSMSAKSSRTRIAGDLMTASNELYCSPESFQRGRCSTISTKNMPDADISANSLMGTAIGESETFSPDEYQAALAYVKWTTDPLPPEPLPIGMEKTNAGKAYLLELRRRAAVISASQHAMDRIIASRTIRN